MLYVGFLARNFLGEDMNLLVNFIIMTFTFLFIEILFFRKYKLKNNLEFKNLKESNIEDKKSLVKISEKNGWSLDLYLMEVNIFLQQKNQWRFSMI